jgi:hypothetical protein
MGHRLSNRAFECAALIATAFVRDRCGLDKTGAVAAAERELARCDTDLVLAQLRRHRIVGQCFATLKHFASQTSQRLREALRADARLLTIRAEAAERSAQTLSRALAERGVCHAFLKGVAFERQAYGEIGTRFSCDLDVLVAPQDLGATMDWVEARGYRCPDWGSPKKRKWTLSFLHHFRAQNDSPFADGRLEIHFRRFPVYWAPDDRPLVAADLGTQLANGVRVLSPTAAWAFVAEHHAKHGWTHLSQLVDVAVRPPSVRELDHAAVAATPLRGQIWRRALGLGESLRSGSLLEQLDMWTARSLLAYQPLGEELGWLWLDRTDPGGAPLRRLAWMKSVAANPNKFRATYELLRQPVAILLAATSGEAPKTYLAETFNRATARRRRGSEDEDALVATMSDMTEGEASARWRRD